MQGTLRTTLFQQYLRLQMWLLSRIVWYVVWIYIGSLVCFALLRIFTGISIKRLGYFSLRHISIHPRQGLELRIGKFGIMPHRPTVARPGFLTFVISNLEVIVDPEAIIEQEEEASRDAASNGTAGDSLASGANGTPSAGESTASADQAPTPNTDAASTTPDPSTANAASSNAKASTSDDYADAPLDDKSADPLVDANGFTDEGDPFLDSDPSADSKAGPNPQTEGSAFNGIPLLPTKNKKVFKIMRWLVTKMRVFDVHVQSVSFVFNEVVTTVMTAATLRVDLRKTLNYKVSNFVGTLDSYRLAEDELPIGIKLGIIDVYTAEGLEDESPWQVVEDLRFDISGVLNLKTMAAKEMGIQIHSGRLQVDVLYIMETLDKVKRIRSQILRKAKVNSSSTVNSSSFSSFTPPPSASTDKFGSRSSSPEAETSSQKGAVFAPSDKKRMLRAAELGLHLINRIQLTIGVLESVRIPLLRPETLTEAKPKVSDSVMMAVGMKDLNIDVSRMNSKASGFRLMYGEDDLAHQLLFMLASLNVGFDNGDQQEEILYVPMVTGLNRGNVLWQTLKYVASNDPNKVNKAHWRSRWATNAPTVSIEEHQLPDMVRVLMGLGNKKKQQSTSSPSFSPRSSGFATPMSSTSAVNTSGLTKEIPIDFCETDFAKAVDPARSALQHAFPNLDLEIVVTDGTGRVRCKPTKEYQNAMFIASANRIFMSLQSQHCFKKPSNDQKRWSHHGVPHHQREGSHAKTKEEEETDSRRVGYKATVQFVTSEAKVWYHSSNLSRFDLASSHLTELTVTATTLPKLNVEIEGLQDKFHVNLLRHEIFRVMGQLHAALRNPVLEWHTQHPGKRIVHDDAAPVYKGSFLRGIPQVLTKLKLNFVDFSVALASNHFRGKTNDVLGMQFLTRKLVVLYTTKDTPIPKKFSVDASTDGRYFSVIGNDFVLYKADRELLEETQKLSLPRPNIDEGLLEKHAVAQLPQLGLDMWTHSGSQTNIDVRIEPRLKIVFNINLILAFSVLRENINEVLLRHTKSRISKSADESKKTTSESPSQPDETVEVDAHGDPVDSHTSDSKPQETSVPHTTVPSNIAVEQNHVTVNLPRALIKIDMPSDDQLMIELNKATVDIKQGSNPSLSAKGLRMYSKHPLHHEAWCILASFVSVNAEVNLVKKELRDKILLDVDGLRINVPYKFKLYRIIDNGITLAKAIKTLLLQTDKLDTMIVLDPKRIEGVPNVPRTRLQAKQFLLSLEDDYFESDLTLIMLTQLEAAETRRRKLYMFDSRIKKMLRLGLSVLDKGILLQNEQNNHLRNQHHNHHHVGTFDFNGMGSRFTHLDDGVTEKVVHAASHLKRGATNVFEHKPRDGEVSRQHSTPEANGGTSKPTSASPPPVPRGTPEKENSDESQPESGEMYAQHLAQALQHVRRDKIEALLHDGLELGDPADDSDSAFTQGHVWLDFWSNKTFSRFRQMKVILSNGAPGKLTIDEARTELLADFSRMWIDTIRHARMTQHYGARRKQHEKVQDIPDKNTCSEEMIADYSQKPLLMAVDLRQIDLTIAKTEHDTSEKLHKFMHDIGKGQPLDTEFSILVPLWLDIKARDGLRVDIKDFPLPVLHFPGLARNQDPMSNLALRIQGNVIITEQLMHTHKSIRRLFVPLKVLPKEKRQIRGSDVIEVHRTLTPIKTFTDLKTHVGTTLPTRVGWCMAYKPAFHSVGESFSGFSKPPIDPSPALGFWDKIRLVLHARFHFHFPKSPLCLTMKAGKSPYSLLNSNSGFIFLWRDDVHVNINREDDPKNLITFESDRFELLVPNYMSWEAEFLNATPAERAFPRKVPLRKPENADKVVFSFNQRTIWQLGMKFEKGRQENFRDPETGRMCNMEVRDAKFRPHYDVQMSMPDYIDDIESYDAYRGFRSDFIYMAISVRTKDLEPMPNLDNADDPTEDSNSANKNACHLTMGVIQHFKAWKGQFNSEQWPPIKTGSLFPDPVRARPSTKTFGTALSTSSYQIVLNTLDLSFFQHLDSHRGNTSHDRSTGLKAKIEEFAFDWHTRREPPTIQNDKGDESNVELNGQRRWRMRSYMGQVKLKAVHLRAMDAKLRTQSSKQALRALHENDTDDSDEDFMDEDTSNSDSDSHSVGGSFSQRSGSKLGSNSPFGVSDQHPYGPRYLGKDHWIDWDDFSEVGVHRVLRSKTPEVKVLPFAYTPEFCFVRHTDFSDKAVYVDPKTGNRFPKFGDIDVQTYHVKAEEAGRVQARLLETRSEHLKERLDDLRASYESLEGDSSAASSAQKKRMREILALLAIGKHNLDVLDREMERYTEIARKDDHRMKQVTKRLAKDLKDSLHLVGVYDKHEKEELKKKVDVVESYADDIPTEELDFASFRNRYIIHAMHLKWNNSVRDLIYRLQYSFSEDKELHYVRCRPAVQYLEELVAKAEEMAREREEMDALDAKERAKEGEEGANEKIREVKSDDQGHVHWTGSNTDNLNRMNTKSSRDEKNGNESGNNEGQSRTCNDRLRNLFSDLKNVNEKEIARKAHHIYLPTPRIQLISEENPSKCLQIIAENIEVQAVDTFPKNSNFDVDSSKIERRMGAMLNKAGFFVLGEQDVDQSGVESLSLERYSGEEEENCKLWPPWLAVELCYDPESMKQFQVVKDVEFGITLHKPNDLHVAGGDESGNQNLDERALADLHAQETSIEMREGRAFEEVEAEKAAIRAAELAEKLANERETRRADELADKAGANAAGIPGNLHKTLRQHGDHQGKAILTSIVVDAPQVVIEVDSVQFYTIYTIAVDLLKYRDPLIKKREEAINRVFLMNDFEGDYRASLKNIELLQKDIRGLYNLDERLQIHTARLHDMDHDAQVHLIKLKREVLRRQTRLIVLIRAFKASLRRNMNTGVDKLTKWSLLADAIDMRLLNEVGDPIMELLLRRAHFSQLSNDDEGSVNRATLAGFSGRNLLKNSVYPQMLANYETPGEKKNGATDAIKLKWTRLERVGGIPVLDNAEVKLKPIHIQVEHGMFEKIIDFAFPITDNGSSKQRIQEASEDDNSDDSSYEASDSDVSVTLSELEREGSEEKARQKKRELMKSTGPRKKRGLFRRLVHPHGSSKNSVDVDEMLNRASSFWSIRSLVIRPTELVVSYRGKSHSVLNIQNLHVNFPGLEVENKTWTKLDLIMKIKKVGIKILVSQSGSIIGNMLKRHKRHAVEDDRDVGFTSLGQKLVTSSTAELLQQEVKNKETLEAMSRQLQPHLQSNQLVKEVEMALVPYHRRMAIEHPEMAKEVTREATAGPVDLSKLQRKESTSTRSGAKTISGKNGNSLSSGSAGYHHGRSTSGSGAISNGKPTASIASSSGSGSYPAASKMRHASGSIQPGSPQQLRQPQNQQSLPNRQLPISSSRDVDSQSTTSTSSRSAKIFSKIKRGFN